LPITALATYLGSQLEELHPTPPLVIGSLAFLLVLLLAFGWLSGAMADDDATTSEDVAR
jgi:hypothetical protein